jgi:hypothetical protein
VQKVQQQPDPDKAPAEASITRFTITLCPNERQLSAEPLNFEEAFPRQRNQQQRDDWLKRTIQ